MLQANVTSSKCVVIYWVVYSELLLVFLELNFKISQISCFLKPIVNPFINLISFTHDRRRSSPCCRLLDIVITVRRTSCYSAINRQLLLTLIQDGLMELLKKDKHSIKAKHDTPLKTLTAVNNAAMKVQHAGTNPSHLLNANKKFSTIDREGDGIKESLNKNLNSKENVNEIVDNKYARLMTGDENYIAAIPLLANSKRR